MFDASNVFRVGARLLAVMLAAMTGVVHAANPASGTLSPANPTITYTAGPFSLTNESYSAGAGTCSPSQIFPCDDFALTVNLPADYASTHPTDIIRMTTTWPDGGQDFDIYVLDASGTDAFGGQTTTGNDPEIGQIAAGAGTRSYTVRIVPYNANGNSTTTKIELITPPPVLPEVPPLKPSGQPPRFVNYTPSLDLANSGEPSVGYNPKSGNAMYIASTSQYRVVFPEKQSPALPEACDSNWIDASSTTAGVITLDPILFTDLNTGRTFVSQLSSALGAAFGSPVGFGAGANSIFAYTDDDGANWTPGGIGPPQTTVPPEVQGTYVISGLDHQTVGSGPYVTGLKPATASYDRAVYYCSQGFAKAFCTRSDDGGFTFPSTGVVIYTAGGNGCGGLHGHVRVGPDGSVYVPNKDCHGHASIAVSEDIGNTWTVRENPFSTSGESDPQYAITTDPNVGYLCYIGSDGHVRATVTKDKGKTWFNDYDIGYYAPEGIIQNSAFPQAIAGDPDRASCAFIGTTTAGNFQSSDFKGVWYAYVATTYDQGKTWHTVSIAPNDPVQRAGGICQGGSSCSGNNRNLLDFNEITVDEKGRTIFGYADGCVGDCVKQEPNSFSNHGNIARLTGGRGLLAKFDPPDVGPPLGACLAGQRDQTAAHLTWRVPDNGGAAITKYNIYRSTAAGAETLIATTATAKPAYDDKTADPAVANYYYRITALNGSTEGKNSNEITLPVVAIPPALTTCKTPGPTVLSDPQGDILAVNGSVPANNATPWYDIRSLSIAQPYAQNGDYNLIFTLKMQSLSTVPPNTTWPINFCSPGVPACTDTNAAISATNKYYTLRMVTSGSNNAGAAPVFQLLQPNNNDTTRTTVTLGAGTGYNADGTITFTVAGTDIGLTKTGAGKEKLTSFLVRINNGAVTPDNMPDTVVGAGAYSTTVLNFCAPNIAPVASLLASVTEGNAPLTVQFDGSGSTDSDAGDTIASFSFDFGDGSDAVTQSAAKVTHTYSKAGFYPAKLTVTDSRGLISSNVAQKNITAKAGSTTPVISGNGSTSGATSGDTGRFGGGAFGLALLPLLLAAGRRRRG